MEKSVLIVIISSIIALIIVIIFKAKTKKPSNKANTGGIIRPACQPVSFNEPSNEVLDNKIKMLKDRIGPPRVELSLSDEEIGKFSDTRFEAQTINAIVKRVLTHMGMEKSKTIVSISVDDGNRNSHIAGTYSETDRLKVIDIVLRKDYGIYEILAIICHECSHYFLYKNGIVIFDDTLQNEILTDVTAVYLGFGEYMGYGYSEYIKTDRSSMQTISHKIGYISALDVTYIRNRITVMRVRVTQEQRTKELEDQAKWEKEKNAGLGQQLLTQYKELEDIVLENARIINDIKSNPNVVITPADKAVTDENADEIGKNLYSKKVHEYHEVIYGGELYTTAELEHIKKQMSIIYSKLLLRNMKLSKYTRSNRNR